MPKLLLADDSVTIQRVIELTFADEQIQVIAVGDGQEAVQRIEAEYPDVILADVGMPRRDGYEVAAHVKKTPHLRHIPVVLLTGAFEPIDGARARAVGCDGVLVKPFEPQMVINRVKDLLAGRRPASLWEGAPAAAGAPASGPASPPEPSPASSGPPADLSPPDAPASRADSLDAYFDRLDAAFSQHAAPGPPAAVETGPSEPVVPATPADFGDWDLPLTPAMRPMDRPAASSPGAASASPPPQTVTPAGAQAVEPTTTVPSATLDHGVEGTAPSAVEGPALADAFAALLAAEQGLGTRPVIGGSSAGGVSDEVVEETVRRALTRMTEQVVRETVLQVAERLVREEIERVKKGAS
jgi:CheY-like chemotaxis protein